MFINKLYNICLIISAAMTILMTLAIPALSEQFVVIELQTENNSPDGCIDCGCRNLVEFEPGERKQLWISFGEVESDDQGNWKAVASSSHCGEGIFPKSSTDLKSTIGIPFVILELSSIIATLPGGETHLETDLKFSKLSGFDKKGESVYEYSSQKRTLGLTGENTLILPLLIANTGEKKAFGVDEILVRLKATILGKGQAASYGMVSVSADVPAAWVFLDGNLVGRIVEGSPLLLKNVLTGTREILVRDFSGREARKEVIVEKGKNSEVSLKIFKNFHGGSDLNSLVTVGKNPQGYEEYWRVKDSALVVLIPAGEFLMGSAKNNGEPSEQPQHLVYLSDFFIDKTEVTWRQFRKYAETTGRQMSPSPISGTPDDYPVSFILWKEAKDYCEWIGGRLPTEAEWEKAARGTDGRKYPWGNEWDQERCNSIDGGPHSPEGVGSFPACVSPYGLLDMSGSMWEWCSDWYDEQFYSKSPSANPHGPASGTRRIIRGGAWMSQPLWLRTTYRFSVPPTTRKADHSFRCVQEVQESSK